MKYHVKTSRVAQNDLNRSASYITFQLKNPASARQLLAKSFKVINSLEEFPSRIPLVRDSLLASLGIRAVAVDHYLLFYQIEESKQTVHVLRFLYGKSNWSATLKNDLPRS